MVARRRFHRRGEAWTYTNQDAPDHPLCIAHCNTSAYKLDGVEYPEYVPEGYRG
jgi:hypothetical protein